APLTTIQPQINEITRSTDGFLLYASNLQLRIHIDDPRFIAKSEVFELKCVADIMAIASVRRESKITATILALQDTTSHKQRLMGQSSTSGGDSLLRCLSERTVFNLCANHVDVGVFMANRLLELAAAFGLIQNKLTFKANV
uniref:Uncharacterized protein n=1 Tax=Glossina pallidipes TaxID=7398 RepID=A0A1A9ZST5_GLOPL